MQDAFTGSKSISLRRYTRQVKKKKKSVTAQVLYNYESVSEITTLEKHLKFGHNKGRIIKKNDKNSKKKFPQQSLKEYYISSAVLALLSAMTEDSTGVSATYVSCYTTLKTPLKPTDVSFKISLYVRRGEKNLWTAWKRPLRIYCAGTARTHRYMPD